MRHQRHTIVLTGMAVLLALLRPLRAAQVPSVAEIIKNHLEQGLGPADLRTVHQREVRGVGQAQARELTMGGLSGTFTLTTTPSTMSLLVDFMTTTYEGELFEFDSAKASVGFSRRALGKRSALGTFMSANEVILREGLLGGVLNAGWPLLDQASRQPKIESEGLQMFDRRQRYCLRYRAKKGQGDLTIRLYLETTTFRHIATVYSASQAQNLGRTITSSSQESEIHFQLAERFADFQPAGGLTLPTTWSMDYDESGNRSTSWHYAFKVSRIERK